MYKTRLGLVQIERFSGNSRQVRQKELQQLQVHLPETSWLENPTHRSLTGSFASLPNFHFSLPCPSPSPINRNRVSQQPGLLAETWSLIPSSRNLDHRAGKSQVKSEGFFKFGTIRQRSAPCQMDFTKCIKYFRYCSCAEKFGRNGDAGPIRWKQSVKRRVSSTLSRAKKMTPGRWSFTRGIQGTA